MTDLTPEARALTRAVREAERPDPGARDRIRGRLLAAIGGGASVGALPAAAAAKSAATAGAATAATGAVTVGGGSVATVTVGKVAVWLAIGLGGGTATMATGYAVQTAWRSQATESAPTAQVVAVPSVAAAPAAVPPQPRWPAEAASAAFAAEPVDSLPATAPRPSSSGPSSTLAEERSLVERAQLALRDGNPARALELLDQHARRYPAGLLVEERRAARVLALCRLGRLDAAKDESNRLVAETPDSPLAPRVRRSCGFDR